MQLRFAVWKRLPDWVSEDDAFLKKGITFVEIFRNGGISCFILQLHGKLLY